jgi:hypothetical protein
MANIMQAPSDNSVEDDSSALERIQRQGVALNIIILGVVLGLGAGLILFLFTQLSLAVMGENAGHYLNLLGVFLPGYSASPLGAWVGLFWGFVVGGFSGAFGYWLYARNIDQRVADLIKQDDASDQMLEPPTLLLSGNSFGIAIGLLAALQLLAATLWLVVRGTGDNSPHAALLGQYLPGYEVNFVGALYGSAELFLFVYVAAQVFSWVYNKVASRGDGDAS